ncbi:MAG: cyclic nucleotide-binding domain-containing protein [Myxococcota bacterium]
MAEDLRRLKDRASAALADGRLREARAAYEQVIQRDPRDLGCRMKMGDIERRSGQIEKAIQTYADVARRFAQDGHLLKAIAASKVILSMDPSHTETQGRLAELYARRQQGAQSVAARLGGGPAPGAQDMGGPPRRGAIPQQQTWAGKIEVEDAPPPGPPVRGGIPQQATWAGQVQAPATSSGSAPVARIRPRAPIAPASTAAGAPPVAPVSTGDVPRSRPARTEDPSFGLPQIPLFSELPRAAFVDLLVHIKTREARSGQVIIREGDPGDAFFVVSSGRVLVSRRNDQGRPVLLARLREGAFFGEMAMLQRTRRTATVTAEVESQVFEISRPVLDRIVREHPSVERVLENFQRQRLLATIMASHELFRPFSPADRRSLMEKFKARSFAKNTVLLREGDPPSGLYILLYGHMAVTTQQGSQKVRLATLGPGDMFGEMSLIANEPTSASVTAEEEVLVIRLSRARFQEVMMTHPHVLEVVAGISERRMEENEDRLGLGLTPQAAILV